jgi:hypothetical protein
MKQDIEVMRNQIDLLKARVREAEELADTKDDVK